MPECRPVISVLITFLRRNQKDLLKGKKSEVPPTEEMLEFAQVFIGAYKAKGSITILECAKNANVSTSTVMLLLRETGDFFRHVQSISKNRLKATKRSMMNLGRFFSISDDQLEEWWNRIQAFCDRAELNMESDI